MGRSSILVRFGLVFLLSLGLVGGASYLMLRNVYHAQLHSEARTISENVISFGSWVSQYGRVWVKDNDVSYLGHMAATDNESQSTVNFYSKNPALAQREFSEVVAKSAAPAKFRMTSDNFMNPVNKPDGFEAAALERVKKNKLGEYGVIEGSVYRYVRTLIHQPSCITCHGDVANAPADVTKRYGTEGGFGFKAGDVAGVISVTIPAKTLSETALEVVGPVELGLVLLAFVLAYLFIQFSVINPIRRLTAAADRISIGKDAELKAEQIPANSRNEMDHLALAFNRLRTSMQLAIQRMKAGGPKPPGA
jgi:HAMP domain-containing protein